MQDKNTKNKITIHQICKSINIAIKNSEVVIILLPAFTHKEIAKKIVKNHF